MVAIFARIDNWSRDWTTNFARLDPLASDPELRPQRLAASREEIARGIRDWVEERPRWKIISTDESDEQTRMQLTRTTRLLRMVDDIEVRLIDDDSGTRIEAESQSRVGKGDLGQNPRNLKELLRGLPIPPASGPR